MKSTLIIVYHDRTIEVSDCTLGHYEDSLFRWRVCRSVWGKLWCLFFGSSCFQIEFTHAMNPACIDLSQVIAMQLKQTV